MEDNGCRDMLTRLERGSAVATGAWHRHMRALYEYWRDMAPDPAVLPGRQHFEPMKIHAALPHVWMIDVTREPLRLVYRLLGTKIDQVAGRSIAGLTLEEAHPEVTTDPAFAERYRIPAEQGVGVHVAGRPMHRIERGHRTTEAVILPLAGDGATVDMLLGATVFYRLDGSEY